MVYIPWEEKGVCKFWMLRRCKSGETCKWPHPEPKERQRLWDYYTEQQKLEDERGIPPPTAPPRRQEPKIFTADNETGQFAPYGPQNVPPPPLSESSDSGPNNPRPTPSPPPPPPPPPNSPTKPRNCYRIESSPFVPSELQEVLLPAVTPTPASSQNNHVDASRDPRLAARRKIALESESSLIDASSSPQNGNQSQSSFKTAVNADALETKRAAALRRTRWDSKSTEYKHEEHVIEAAASLHVDFPSAPAITLWKRSDTANDVQMTDVTESRQSSGYWKSSRTQHASEDDMKDDNLNVSSSEKGGVRGESATNSWDSSNLIQLQPQTPENTFSFSSPFTTPVILDMGATKRLSNGEAKHVGPHPSTIRVSAQYMSQAAIAKKLEQATSHVQLDIQERSAAEAREESIRLQGITWIDNVRRSLQLPIRTFTTASNYFQKFRLAHAGGPNGVDYNHAWPDACAASLLTSCKVEDTLKKSRDILAAAYNLKATVHEQLGADDPVFEGPSRVVIGLERLVLEAGGFDFRSKYPHEKLMKLVKSMPESADGENKKVGKIAWTVLTDLYKTFAPLKQTTITMALASLELAAHLYATSSPDNVSVVRDAVQKVDLKAWSTSREEIMETLLDLLDLYTQHTQQTILGSKYSLDDFLRIRLAFNKECNEANIPRYTTAPPSDRAANGSTLRVANGHPTPVSPMEPGPQASTQPQNMNSNQASLEGVGTLRFMLDPQLAADEKAQVQKYFVEEWEEYEEEVEVAQPRQQSHDREAERGRDQETDRKSNTSNQVHTGAPRVDRSEKDRARIPNTGDRDRERARDREREAERERARVRDAERDRRYGDRRYDDRRDRRFEDRRFEDDRRRRDDKR